MAKKTAKVATITDEPTKEQLQRQMARTRESLTETIGDIKDTVEHQVDSVKKGVSNVLDYRDKFLEDPLVLSLGALSAGFALGYTVGYAHKNTKGKKKNQVAAFADTMVNQLSGMGQSLVLPTLDAKISEMFGLDFSAMLAQVSGAKKLPAKKKSAKKKPRALIESKATSKPRRATKSVSPAKKKK